MMSQARHSFPIRVCGTCAGARQSAGTRRVGAGAHVPRGRHGHKRLCMLAVVCEPVAPRDSPAGGAGGRAGRAGGRPSVCSRRGDSAAAVTVTSDCCVTDAPDSGTVAVPHRKSVFSDDPSVQYH